MERHRCKLCLKSFANGRALGGHMRSHMLNLYVPPKAEQSDDQLIGEETESAPSSSSSSSSSSEEEAEEENEDKGQCYELRENPKKSIRLVNSEFSFAVDAGSVVLQDRESETESSKNPIRRRSKRIRKSGATDDHPRRPKSPELRLPKSVKLGGRSEWAEAEPASSVSDATTEEDVAYCLMMLSRDKWMRDDEEEGEPEQYMEDQTEESDELVKCSKARARRKYKCETCNKVFRSYQALGGHRASHKKINKGLSTQEASEAEARNAGTATATSSAMRDQQKIHECPVCYRVFSSGQALGGHKRSHVTGSAPPPARPPAKFAENLIDLNLPAPVDDDDISQIELSAVSDAEFVNPIKQ